MFESNVTDNIVPRVFAIFAIFDDVMDDSWTNFGEKIMKGGEEIINLISKLYNIKNYANFLVYSLFYLNACSFRLLFIH